MVLNTKPWALVQNGNFVVGDRDIVNSGVTYHPGESFPKEGHERVLSALYATNQITDVAKAEPVVIESNKSKRARRAQ